MTSEHQDDTPAKDENEEVRQRLLLPFLIPAIVFLFAMLAIYGLSRIYIDLKDYHWGDVNAATPLALAVALAILGGAWYLAANPKAGRVQVGGMIAVAAVLLIGGTIWAAIHDEGEAAEHVEGTATPAPTAEPGEVLVSLFEYEVEAEPASIPAGNITFNVENTGTIFHNLRVVQTDLSPGDLPANGEVDESQVDVVAETSGDLEGGEAETVVADLEPGSYVLLCNVVGHYALGMTVAFTVEEAPEGPPPGEGPTPGEGPPPGGAGEIDMQDNIFVFEDEQEPAIPVTAGEELTFDVVNTGIAVHNIHVDGQDDTYAEDFCTTGGDAPCSDPDQIVGGGTGTLTVQFDAAGTYNFRCDYHPTEMFGTFVVQ